MAISHVEHSISVRFLPIYFNVIFIRIFLILKSLLAVMYSEEQLSCPKMSQCIPLTKCKRIETDSFLYPCHAGLNMICCPENRIPENVTQTMQNRKTALFPVNCGLIMSSDKISGGKTAEPGQFPWMALLGYKRILFSNAQFFMYFILKIAEKRAKDLIFSCGGSLITECYVLTAGHCLDMHPSLEL